MPCTRTSLWITEDTENEVRFAIPELLIEHSVRSTVNVVIRARAAQLAERALRQEILGHELQHRINNMLTTIQAVARRTRAKSQSLDEFAKVFEDRLTAIARTHALLNRTHTSKIDIREILTQELSLHGAVEGENLKQRGPKILIPAKQAEVLSMAIHELVTNAAKHGALSVESGHIEISWEAHDRGNENEFQLHWRERARPIPRRPSRRGFGSEFLEKSIPHMLNGRFERRFGSDGMECTVSFLLDKNN